MNCSTGSCGDADFGFWAGLGNVASKAKSGSRVTCTVPPLTFRCLASRQVVQIVSYFTRVPFLSLIRVGLPTAVPCGQTRFEWVRSARVFQHY